MHAPVSARASAPLTSGKAPDPVDWLYLAALQVHTLQRIRPQRDEPSLVLLAGDGVVKAVSANSTSVMVLGKNGATLDVGEFGRLQRAKRRAARVISRRIVRWYDDMARVGLATGLLRPCPSEAALRSPPRSSARDPHSPNSSNAPF